MEPRLPPVGLREIKCCMFRGISAVTGLVPATVLLRYVLQYLYRLLGEALGHESRGLATPELEVDRCLCRPMLGQADAALHRGMRRSVDRLVARTATRPVGTDIHRTVLLYRHCGAILRDLWCHILVEVVTGW